MKKKLKKKKLNSQTKKKRKEIKDLKRKIFSF